MKLSEIGAGLKPGDVLCSIEDIDEFSAKEFSFRVGYEVHDIFIQRKNDEIFAFLNICPHAGTPLNMEQGQFLEKTRTYLMCHTHGALFQLNDGLCVAGPCNGAHLETVEIKLENDHILIV